MLGAALLTAGLLGWELAVYALTTSSTSGGTKGSELIWDAALAFAISWSALWFVSGRRRRPGPASLERSTLIALTFACLAVPAALVRALAPGLLASLLGEAPEPRFLCAAALPSSGPAQGVLALIVNAVRGAAMLQVPVLPLTLVGLWLKRRAEQRPLPAPSARVLRAATVAASLAVLATCIPSDSPRRYPASVGRLELEAGCAPTSPVRTYDVAAIDVTMTLNRFGDHDPEAFMYVLESQLPAVRAQEQRSLPDRVSTGLRKDAIQPLILRANAGECLIINFTNRLSGGDASMHIHGLPHLVTEAGGAVGNNPDTFASPGQTVSYVLPIPQGDQAEGIRYIHDGGASRQRVAHGLFGALVVEPAGSRYLDPETGGPLTVTNWEAIIENPGQPDFRELVLIFHEIGDESFDKIKDARGSPLPTNDDLTGSYRPGSRALNYRSEPHRDRLLLKQDESHAYGSYMFGDPATPVPRSYLGEPTKTRLLHGGSEVFHVFHLHGGADRWRANPRAEPSDFATGLQKRPVQNTVSTRLDSQAMGPSTAFDLEHECGAGGCQQAAGDFLYHCHVQHHYLSGMWAFWRVFDTRQPDLATLPDRAPLPAAVDSVGLIGRLVEGKVLVPRQQLTAPSTERAIEDWVESQLPPRGARLNDEDATVWDWERLETASGPLYLGEPETTEVWANYRSDFPGQRPRIAFNPANGRYAWPLLRPHLGKRPPFSPNGHSGAPWLGEKGSALRRDGLCPNQEVLPDAMRQTRVYPISAIALPIQVTPKREDRDGMIFVLSENKQAVRSGQKPTEPLVIRSNVGDCLDILLTNEIPDLEINGFHSKVNMHSHFIQFDPQASDGVITGFSYEQSVRPYQVESRTLSAPASAGGSEISVTHVERLRPGIWVGIGLGRGICQAPGTGAIRACTEVRRIAEINGTALVLDAPLELEHSVGEHVGVEFVRYAWFSDVDSGTVFWHDHILLGGWSHGLYGAHIVEPRGSTYHDPRTGLQVRSGPIVDVYAPPTSSVGHGQSGSFREYFVGLSSRTDAAEATVNLRAEPLDDRDGPPSLLFSSVQHGDPHTPLLRAYLGDPVVIRGLGVVEIVDGLRVLGHRYRAERFSEHGYSGDTSPIGISERLDMVLEGGAGSTGRKPGDYLYYDTLKRNLLGGAWGILRVHDTLHGGLRPLPDRPVPPSGSGFPHQSFTGGPPSAATDPGQPCPAGAPLRQYRVKIAAQEVAYHSTLRDSNGVAYMLDGAGPGSALEPLVLRVNHGECLEVQLTNRLDQPAALALGGLPFDPNGSSGFAIGFNQDSSVAPGQTRLYRYWADQELGTYPLLNLANPETVARGAYGAVVVEAAGSVYVDSRTGAPLAAGISATIRHPDGDFRELVALLADEDPRIGQNTMPYPTRVEGFAGISYAAEPFERRNAGDAPTQVFSSQAHGDPRLVALAHAGDPFVFRVAQPWGEQAHVFSVDGYRWAQEPHLPGTRLVDSRALVPGVCFEARLEGDTRSGVGASGDFLFQDHRTPFLEAGLWGILRVLPKSDPSLLPLSGAPAPVQSSFTPVADARVQSDRPDRNFGSSASLGADLSPVVHESYLKFTVSGVGPIQSAKLRLFLVDGSSNGPALYSTGTSWTEASITWSNRPPAIGAAIGNLSAVSTGAWVEYDLTAAVTGNGTYGFKLVADSSNGTDASSREGQDPPQLAIVSGASTCASTSNLCGQTLSFIPTEDARVQADRSGSNFGGSPWLGADLSPVIHESYLKFAVSGAGAIQSAKLRLFLVDGSTNGPALYSTGNTWSEASITWDNRPPPVGVAIGNLGVVSTGTWVEYELTSVTGDGTYSFKLAADSSNGTDASSREGANPPQLVITTGNPP